MHTTMSVPLLCWERSMCNIFLFCQDESSTLQLLKKQLALEQTIEDYAETIGLLSQQCRQLLELRHPDRCVFVCITPCFLIHLFLCEL